MSSFAHISLSCTHNVLAVYLTLVDPTPYMLWVEHNAKMVEMMCAASY